MDRDVAEHLAANADHDTVLEGVKSISYGGGITNEQVAFAYVLVADYEAMCVRLAAVEAERDRLAALVTDVGALMASMTEQVKLMSEEKNELTG